MVVNNCISISVTYLKLLAFFHVEVSHDKLVHAHVHRQLCRVQNLILEEEGTNVIALQELFSFNRGLYRVVVGVRHRSRKVCELILEHEAEGLLEELLHVAILGFSSFHQVFQVG